MLPLHIPNTHIIGPVLSHLTTTLLLFRRCSLNECGGDGLMVGGYWRDAYYH